MDAEVDAPLERPRLALPLALFAATVLSTLNEGAQIASGWAVGPLGEARSPLDAFHAALGRHEGYGRALAALGRALSEGWVFAVPLLGILLAHEFGHWLMARRHRVEASLPMFIPFPNLFGTMGAVISMRGRIRTRDALVDIGAAGPLAGLAVAVPVMALGLSLSRFAPAAPKPGMTLIEGDSLLYLAMKHLARGAPPPGQELWLHPVALAAWAGFFVTMLNLLPIGQLDGGHVAYALFGRRHDRWSQHVIKALAALGLGVAAWLALTTPRKLLGFDALTPAVIWLAWAVFARVLTRMTGDAHPPTDDGPLSPARRVVAAVTLVAFALLFMPLPMRVG